MDVGEKGCTHLVLEESYSFDVSADSVKASFVVKQEVCVLFINYIVITFRASKHEMLLYC